jgi:hypothetical protein
METDGCPQNLTRSENLPDPSGPKPDLIRFYQKVKLTRTRPDPARDDLKPETTRDQNARNPT